MKVYTLNQKNISNYSFFSTKTNSLSHLLIGDMSITISLFIGFEFLNSTLLKYTE
jgi:hypothetical protein